MSSTLGIKLQEFYTKYQTLDGFFKTPPSDNFIYIPGLNQAFHITRRTLFKITYQGGIYNDYKRLAQFVQIMVNDHIILGNKLVPNTAQRVNYGLGSTIDGVDSFGGQCYEQGGPDPMVPFTRVAHVYLPPGTYTFNVGTRSLHNTGSTVNGFVTFEITQYENQSLESIGEFTFSNLL